jgi:hypothetical protein
MNQDIKERIVSILKPEGHRHMEMSEAVKCRSCGVKMARARNELARLTAEHPEGFIRKAPEEKFHRETENLGDMLTERIKSDAMYQKHLKLLQYGTPEEKIRELKRMESGYYTRRGSNSTKAIII